MKSWFWIVIPFVLISGCGSSPAGRQLNGSGLIPGKVYGNVKCREHPACSYAIYIPCSDVPGNSLPVILAFDPSGSGDRPVNLYKEVAEKYGFLLIGSNNSRNGQSPDQTWQILAALLTEITGCYQADAERIYCTGFSGGSRVSSMIAFYRGGIRGVIGCGAGLPSTTTPIRYPTNFYGIVGDQDFNYLEMVGLESDFHVRGINSTLRIFHGRHDWPPREEFEAAIRWHWAHAIREGLIPSDPLLQSASDTDTQRNLDFLNSIDRKELEKEMKQQELYSESLLQKGVPWWEEEMQRLNHPANPVESLMNRRLISYISILIYTFSNQALAGRNREELARMIGIYETVDPENSYIPRLKEQLNSLP